MSKLILFFGFFGPLWSRGEISSKNRPLPFFYPEKDSTEGFFEYLVMTEYDL